MVRITASILATAVTTYAAALSTRSPSISDVSVESRLATRAATGMSILPRQQKVGENTAIGKLTPDQTAKLEKIGDLGKQLESGQARDAQGKEADLRKTLKEFESQLGPQQKEKLQEIAKEEEKKT